VPRKSKLTNLSEAAATISDGMRIAFGGFAIYQRPMALARELVRRGCRDLTVVGIVNSIETDILVGGGCIRRIETSYMGLEKYGLARNFRRAVEAGILDIIDYPELLAWDRFRANQENLPFWPCTFLGGSDVVTFNQDIILFECPISKRKLWAVPPADPDVVIVHAMIGDEFGNVAFPRRRLLPQSVDVTHTRSCDTVIVSVEKIVSTKEIRRHPELTEVPAFRTTHIVEAPFGAHPTSMLGLYTADDEHFDIYSKSSSNSDDFENYLDKYIRNVEGHLHYLEKIGLPKLIKLRTVEMTS